MAAWKRRIIWTSAAFVVLIIGVAVMLLLPTTTLQGVNYRVTAYTIPAYVKALDFVQRHYQYRLQVSRICAAKTSEADCTMAIFDWTHEHIPPTPPGWPVIDDHPLHIIIRGHGKDDQIADVFVTLTDYAGVPAFFKFVTDQSHRTLVVLAFASLDGRWVTFDVRNHIAFRNRGGRLASVDELVNDPSLVDGQTQGLLHDGLPYSTFISRQTLMPFTVPHPLRGEMQQPWARTRYELRKAVGWERE